MQRMGEEQSKATPGHQAGSRGPKKPRAGSGESHFLPVEVPPSKSLLQRALLAAAWAGGVTRVQFPGDPGRPGAQGADSADLILALGALGQQIHPSDSDPGQWDVLAPGFRELGDCTVALGESATAARILTGALAFAGRAGSRRTLGVSGTLALRHSPALLASLRRAGCEIEVPGPGTWPLQITSVEMPGELVLENPVSSQEISALLYALAFQGGGRLTVVGDIPSAPYVDMTLAVLAGFGREFRIEGDATFVIGPDTHGALQESRSIAIEADASSAAVAWVAGILGGRSVGVLGLPEESCQGDARLLDFLEGVGVSVGRGADSGWWASGVPNRGLDLDLADCPDLAPPLVALAMGLALGHFGQAHSSRLTGLGTLQGKESPRLEVLGQALVRVGCPATWTSDTLNTPTGNAVSTPIELDPMGDHRMAFAFALMGLVVPTIHILGKDCVSKSWPGFWTAMANTLGNGRDPSASM